MSSGPGGAPGVDEGARRAGERGRGLVRVAAFAREVGADGVDGLGGAVQADLGGGDHEVRRVRVAWGAPAPFAGGSQGVHPVLVRRVGLGGQQRRLDLVGEVAHGLAGEVGGVLVPVEGGVQAHELHFEREERGVLLGEPAGSVAASPA